MGYPELSGLSAIFSVYLTLVYNIHFTFLKSKEDTRGFDLRERFVEDD